MFINLCNRPGFLDYNFSTFFDRLEKWPESAVKDWIRQQGESRSWDPYLASVMDFTISEPVCWAFFRDHRDVPAMDRDFYLSKFCQFLTLAISTAIQDPARHFLCFGGYGALCEEIDRLPDPVLLADLHRFRYLTFQMDLRTAAASDRREAPREVCVDLLEKYLPGVSRLRPADEMDYDGADRRARRHALHQAYRECYPEDPSWVKTIATKARCDASDYHKWHRAELGDDSATTQNIERAIRELLAARSCSDPEA